MSSSDSSRTPQEYTFCRPMGTSDSGPDPFLCMQPLTVRVRSLFWAPPHLPPWLVWVHIPMRKKDVFYFDYVTGFFGLFFLKTCAVYSYDNKWRCKTKVGKKRASVTRARIKIMSLASERCFTNLVKSLSGTVAWLSPSCWSQRRRGAACWNQAAPPQSGHQAGKVIMVAQIFNLRKVSQTEIKRIWEKIMK